MKNLEPITWFKVLVGILFLVFVVSVRAAGPRTWSKSGTATIANSQVTVGGSSPFGPASVCVQNTGATNDLWFNWTTGVAAAVDNANNVKVAAGESPCFSFDNPNVANTMVIGLITSVNTTTYKLTAIGAR